MAGLSKLRTERRAARQVYPFGMRGSASELWYLHRKLARPSEPEQRVAGFRLERSDSSERLETAREIEQTRPDRVKE